jgi:hypothetical protein
MPQIAGRQFVQFVVVRFTQRAQALSRAVPHRNSPAGPVSH